MRPTKKRTCEPLEWWIVEQEKKFHPRKWSERGNKAATQDENYGNIFGCTSTKWRVQFEG